jgi:probable rRNA maturation factor
MRMIAAMVSSMPEHTQGEQAPESAVVGADAPCGMPEVPDRRPIELIVDLQVASDEMDIPAPTSIEAWVLAALSAGSEALPAAAELTIRIVDETESAELNERYRERAGPTNVLSFPFDLPPGIDAQALTEMPALLGDLVICAPVVVREAAEQGKTTTAHWAHLVVHGVLHLLGHDHIEPGEATRMEALETAIIRGLGFPSPYEVSQGTHDERPI